MALTKYTFSLTGEQAGKTMTILTYPFINGEYSVYNKEVADKQGKILCEYYACERTEEVMGGVEDDVDSDTGTLLKAETQAGAVAPMSETEEDPEEV